MDTNKLNRKSTDEIPPLSMHAQISHATLMASEQEQACYVLLDITPTQNLPTSRLPLNLCLVLDKSTSMQGVRLQQVKEATRQIIDYLQPEDTLSLVVFSDKAEVLFSGYTDVDKAKVKSIASTIQPSGGTEMLQGLLAGLKEVQAYQRENTVNHLILLTDGRTYGDEDQCQEQAEWAGRNQISFSTMGIGADWNEDLLDAMATTSGGLSTYIDSPRKIVDTFKATVKELSTIVVRKTDLIINPSKDVLIQEAFHVAPHIRRLEISSNRATLGPLGTNGRKVVILELRLKNFVNPGEKRLARLALESDMSTAQKAPLSWVDVTATIVANPSAEIVIPPLIVTALGKLAIFKMQEKAMTDLEVGNIIAATQRLETMATRLLNLGETELARAALLEAGRLSRTGNFSAEGRKKIRYGTRSLSIMPKEIRHD